MALTYKYSTSGGLKLSGSADNLSSILHYYQFENNNLDSFGFFDLVGNNQYQAGVVNEAALTSKFSTIQGNANKNGAFYNGNSFTFSMWFKIGTTTKDQNIFYLDSPDEDFVIKYDAASKKIYFNSLSNPISSAILSGTTWYFVCIRKNGSNVYVQLNNQPAVSYSYSYLPIRFNSVVATNLDVVAPSKYSALFWDDVRFYKNYLRSEEVSYVYNNGSSKPISGGDQANLWNKQNHYYAFDDSANDSSGSANLVLTQYSISGGTSPILAGKFNNALQIGNTYSLNSYLGYDYYGYTSYNGNILGTAGESYSLSFWVKRFADPLEEIVNQISILSILTSANNNIIQFGYGGKNLFKVDDGTVSGATIEVPATLTNWNHFGVVYNADQGRYAFYLNGNIFGEIKATRSLINAGRFYLGWDGTTYESGNPYLCQDALIDDLRIYNFAITGWDFVALYALGSFNTLEKSLNINFAMGTLPLKTFQVESYDFYEDSSTTQIVIPNAQHKLRTIIQQISATDINEVCKKIKDINFFMNIKSIAEWSNNLFGPYGGGKAGRDQYGSYVDIPNFCENAECVDFCLGVNAIVSIAGVAYASSEYNAVVGSGGANLYGTASALLNKYQYATSGYFELAGSAIASQVGGATGNPYSGGGSFELGGSAGQRSSDQGNIVVETELSMSVTQITALLKTDPGSALTGTAVSSRQSICDCKNVPQQISLRHNLNKSSELTRFLTRNNLTIPSIVTMLYNKKIDKYSANINLEGFSSFVNAKEYWNIIFTMYCTGEYNSFAGRYNWILNMNIRRSTVGFGDKETNVITYLLSSYICPQFDASKFNFKVNINLNTLIVQVNNSSFINSVNINDGIGLFLSDAWKADPNITMAVGA